MSVWKSRGMTDCLEFTEAWRWRKKENDKGNSRDRQIKGKKRCREKETTEQKGGKTKRREVERGCVFKRD